MIINEVCIYCLAPPTFFSIKELVFLLHLSPWGGNQYGFPWTQPLLKPYLRKHCNSFSIEPQQPLARLSTKIGVLAKVHFESDQFQCLP